MFGLPAGTTACLFDMDGVVTQTALVHAAAWKDMFDKFLRQRAEQTGGKFVPFDSTKDYGDYVDGKADSGGTAGDEAAVARLADDIFAAIEKEPLYYTDIAERFANYDFRTIARALGHLHAAEKLWQDPRGRMCVRGSNFAAKPPVK